jgi:hypothetical protein
MTGIDYRREWNLIRQQERSLNAHVHERIKELCKLYPDAPVDEYGNTAKELSKHWLEALRVDSIIMLIEDIEKWSAKQHPYVQARIKL